MYIFDVKTVHILQTKSEKAVLEDIILAKCSKL